MTKNLVGSLGCHIEFKETNLIELSIHENMKLVKFSEYITNTMTAVKLFNKLKST